MAAITLEKVTTRYGEFTALSEVSLDIEDGSFVVFVGPSGCGKSTLLRTIAGLELCDSGTIKIGERDVTDVEPSERDVAMVFQSYALYPHMTVRKNMEFGLKVKGVGPEDRGGRVTEAARILQLEKELERKPAQLSGGQRQRVAIGRAIVKNPQVFLFDEPLSNLDAKLRVRMRVELEALHGQLKTTMVYVTHDQTEAMTMAEQIVVLNGGRVEQTGPPLELYKNPRTEFVAGFIGSPAMCIFKPDELPSTEGLGLQGDAAKIGIRPEHMEVTAQGAGLFDATVKVRESLGSEGYLYLNAPSGLELVAKVDGEDDTQPGATVGVRIPLARMHQFDGAGLTIS